MAANYNQEGLQDLTPPQVNSALNKAEGRERQSYFSLLSLLLPL